MNYKQKDGVLVSAPEGNRNSNARSSRLRVPAALNRPFVSDWQLGPATTQVVPRSANFRKVDRNDPSPGFRLDRCVGSITVLILIGAVLGMGLWLGQKLEDIEEKIDTSDLRTNWRLEEPY